MEVYEAGSRTGETEECQARIFRVLVEAGVYFYVGFHQQDISLVKLVVMVWRPRIGWQACREGATYPIDLMNHIIEVGMQARAKWKVPHPVYKLRGGPFAKQKSVREGRGSPGFVEQIVTTAEAVTRLGANLNR